MRACPGRPRVGVAASVGYRHAPPQWTHPQAASDLERCDGRPRADVLMLSPPAILALAPPLPDPAPAVSVTPHERAVTPDGRAVAPHERAVTPEGRAEAPDGRAAAPHGRAVTPHGRDKPAHGRVTTPNGPIRTPEGPQSPPEGPKGAPAGPKSPPVGTAGATREAPARARRTARPQSPAARISSHDRTPRQPACYNVDSLTQCTPETATRPRSGCESDD